MEANENLKRFFSNLQKEGDTFDPLLEEVAECVVTVQKVCSSMIERHFSIGRERSLRILAQLEIMGIVGPARNVTDMRAVLYNGKDDLGLDVKETLEAFKNHDIYSKEREIEERKKQLLQKEKEKIKQEILENRKKRDLRKQAMQELEDEGLLEKVRKREPIPQEVQDIVWRRDGGRCVKCGSQENLEFDHIIPFSKGGSNTARNLQLLCEKCNREKSNHIG